MINFNAQFDINTQVACGDKSISHRALIVGAIASGVSTVCNLSLCQDVLTTANCLRTLGAKIQIEGSNATITPIKKPNDNVVLDCQNSGTTARLLAGIVAGLGITATFVGDKSLANRPMDRVMQPLVQLGAKITVGKDQLFTVHPSKLVGAKLRSKVNSAQVKSAVLLAGLFAEGTTQYLEEIPTRNHTELLLQSCGVNVVDGAVTKCTPKPFNFTIPNDLSSASYLIALALLTNKQITLPSVGANDGRIGFLTVLQQAGAQLKIASLPTVCGEKVANITILPSKLQNIVATEIDVCNAIDEIPILCAIAIATKGTHRFENVGELKHKECDRVTGIINMARACHQTATFDGKNLTICSNGILPKHPNFCAFDDHRMAMCGAVLSLACGGGSVDTFPVAVSFPNFLQALGVFPKKFCVVGADVSQSLSPKLMMHLAKNVNVCCSYDAVSLGNDATDEQLKAVIDSHDGANVTIPFKTRVANLYGAKLSSVNTVGKSILPTSTDGYGVQMALYDNQINLADKQIWVVGAGGGAEAFVEHFANVCQMQIVNRTPQNAQKLTQKYNLSTDITQPFGIVSFVPECHFEQQLQIPNSCQFVFVSAYVGNSGLKQKAQTRGIKVVDGLQMLYHQGAKSFALWTNTPLQSNYKCFADEMQK